MKLVFKGFIIGIAKILPGISGSVIAISLNEYKNIIDSLNNIRNKDNMTYLMKIGIGIILAVIILSRLLFSYIDKYGFYMFTLFIGLIIGTIPKMIAKINKRNIMYIFIGFISLIGINSFNFNIKLNIINRGFIIGMIESISTIVPGISGTAILTNFGLYKEYLFGWSKIYDLISFKSNLAYYLPFLGGLIIVSIILIKIINTILNKHDNMSNGLILGFIIASVVLLFKNISFPRINIYYITIFIVILIVGFIIGYLLDCVSNDK